jgi:hypothetical protein
MENLTVKYPGGRAKICLFYRAMKILGARCGKMFDFSLNKGLYLAESTGAQKPTKAISGIYGRY